jgi:hypothetical protein
MYRLELDSHLPEGYRDRFSKFACGGALCYCYGLELFSTTEGLM